MSEPKTVFFDATFLRFAGDSRGIPQLILLLTRVCAEARFRGKIRILCYPETVDRYLIPMGFRPEDIVTVKSIPLLGKYERFHGLGATWRYGKAMKGTAGALYLPEPRGVTRLPIPQLVHWQDLLQLQGRWSSWRKPSRYLFLRYKYWRASKVRGVAITEHVKRDVLARYPEMDPDSITVAWLGIRQALAGEPSLGPIRLPLECIYVGSLEGRKNVFSLLSHLGDVFRGRDFRFHLVGKISDAERQRAEEAAGEHLASVQFHGMLPDDALRALMQRCDVTLFPSLGEGFGLPVIEAMSHGHIVFVFRNTSLPEIAGDAAVLAENSDFRAWGESLNALLEDPEAALDLRRRALQRVSLFTEEAMKARVRDYLDDLIEEAREEAREKARKKARAADA